MCGECNCLQPRVSTKTLFYTTSFKETLSQWYLDWYDISDINPTAILCMCALSVLLAEEGGRQADLSHVTSSLLTRLICLPCLIISSHTRVHTHREVRTAAEPFQSTSTPNDKPPHPPPQIASPSLAAGCLHFPWKGLKPAFKQTLSCFKKGCYF